MTRRHDSQHKTSSSRPRTRHAEPERVDNVAAVSVDQPRFAQPDIVGAPPQYLIKHPSDTAAYRILDAEQRAHELHPIPFPPSRGGDEPILTLQDILGSAGSPTLEQISKAGFMVFHAVGDTGNTRGPVMQEEVTEKMLHDFTDPSEQQRPRFFFHLGDVIYNFGEARYYYDQFYDAYRNYPAPILALAGNHDGMVAPQTNARTLEAFLDNFCAEHFEVTPEAGGLDRTAQIQPGVYFTFETPLLRILALYSGTLEDPGIISSQDGAFPDISDVQLTFLETALNRVKSDRFAGAVIIAHHHPAYTIQGERGHGSSTDMRKQIDAICDKTGVWPHAVLSAHAHNYQRYTRQHGNTQIPYLIAGAGGHGKPQKLTRRDDPPLRAPATIETVGDKVVLENYDDTDTGYLRILVTKTQLRIEYHPSSDQDMAKTPDDQVTIDLAKRQIVHFVPPSA